MVCRKDKICKEEGEEKKKVLGSLQNPSRVQKRERLYFAAWVNSYYCLAPGRLELCAHVRKHPFLYVL